MVLRALGILLWAALLPAQEVHLQILETTDVRGHVLPVDTFTLQPANGGWARLGTLIRTLKGQNPATVLVDGGDGTQGEPINYVWSRLRAASPEPTMALMNSLGYSAMVVGHLELDLGLARVRAMEEQAQFPWLAANVYFAGTRKHAFTPYLKVEVGGVPVAVLGLVAAPPGGHDGAGELDFQDPVACARELIPQLREREQVDLVVLACHGGAEEECQALADQVPGVDLILAGHTRRQASLRRNEVPILQAGAGGQSLGVADVTLRRAKARWVVAGCTTSLVTPAPELEPDPGVLQATADLRAATEAYLDTAATTLGTDLDGRWGRMEDTPLAHLLHTVVRQATGAQLTAVPAQPPRLFIPKGPTSVRQFYALAPDEAGVARIRITGRQLRAYLEQAARCYNYCHLPDLFNRAAGPGDFDTLDGCGYALDISRAPGQRVVGLTFQGHPVRDEQTFTLGLTAGRLAGAGGYLEAMGWHGEPEYVSPGPLRNLLLAYVLGKGTLTVGTSDNWRIIPALDRERVLAQQN